MLRPAPPMSNAERQRQFPEGNPGYYGRLHAKRRAAVRAMVAERVAAAQVAAAAPAKRAPLLLPAPVEMLLIPGLDAIPATLAELRERAAVPIPVPTSRADSSHGA